MDRVARRAGIALGIGLGGFVDGILLHQILQWHNMGSAVLPPVTMEAMRRNMAWDGLFHLAVWLVTLTGAFWLLADARRDAESFAAKYTILQKCRPVVSAMRRAKLLK